MEQLRANADDKKARTAQQKAQQEAFQELIKMYGGPPQTDPSMVTRLPNGGTLTQLPPGAAQPPVDAPQIEPRPYQLGPDNRAAIAAMPTEPGSRVPVMPNGSRVRTIQLGEDPMPGPDNRAAIAAMPTAPGSSVPVAPDGSRVRTIPGATEQPQQAPQAPQSDKRYQAVLMMALNAGYPIEAAKLMADQNAGKPKVARTVEFAGKDGVPMIQQFDDHGQPVGQPMAKPFESRVVNRGDRQEFVNPYTNQAMGSMGINQSPDSKASNAVAWANNSIAQGQLGVARGNLSVAQQRLEMDRTDPKGVVLDTANGPIIADPRKGTGRPVMVDGKPVEGKLTEGQANAAGYADRMQAAEAIMAKVGQAGNSTMGTTIAGSLPLVGGPAQRLAMNPQQQQVKQAQDDWIRSKLRKESGAVIGAEEAEAERQTYFPMPGDSPQVILQKEQARRIATQAMMRSAGGRSSAMPAPEPAAPARSKADPLGLR